MRRIRQRSPDTPASPTSAAVGSAGAELLTCCRTLARVWMVGGTIGRALYLAVVLICESLPTLLARVFHADGTSLECATSRPPALPLPAASSDPQPLPLPLDIPSEHPRKVHGVRRLDMMRAAAAGRVACAPSTLASPSTGRAQLQAAEERVRARWRPGLHPDPAHDQQLRMGAGNGQFMQTKESIARALWPPTQKASPGARAGRSCAPDALCPMRSDGAFL